MNQDLPPSIPVALETSAMSQASLITLLIAAGVTVLLWQLPQGNYVLYPFTLLATWFHEMAHGLMAMILGAKFEQLLIYPNGSGLAQYSFNQAELGNIGRGLIAGAGPMGPPIAGALFIIAGRYPSATRFSLYLLGILLAVSVLIWVRTGFGAVVMLLIASLILFIALVGGRWLQGFTVQFLGVQACISTYHQVNYLFTYQVVINGKPLLSDTGQMAHYLFLPYWFWGGSIVILSLILLVFSLRMAYRH